MGRQARNDSGPRGHRGWKWWILRILIVIVGLNIVLLIAGFAYETIAARSDWDRYPPPGELIDVGGYRLHLYCSGARREGLPTVVLEAGAGNASPEWALVQPEIAQVTRVCSYDRAGRVWSDPGPEPRSSKVFATELHTLLDAADEPGPYIVVGHSAGGHTVRIFANDYPDQVVGIVLVDPRSEELGSHPLFAPALSDSQMAALAFLARFGVFRIVGRNMLPASYKGNLPDYPVGVVITPRYFEIDVIEDEILGDHDVRQTDGFGDTPLIVIVHGKPDSSTFGSLQGEDLEEAERLWRQAAQKMAGLSSNSQFLVAEGSGHFIAVEQPQVVIDAILSLVD